MGSSLAKPFTLCCGKRPKKKRSLDLSDVYMPVSPPDDSEERSRSPEAARVPLQSPVDVHPASEISAGYFKLLFDSSRAWRRSECEAPTEIPPTLNSTTSGSRRVFKLTSEYDRKLTQGVKKKPSKVSIKSDTSEGSETTTCSSDTSDVTVKENIKYPDPEDLLKIEEPASEASRVPWPKLLSTRRRHFELFFKAKKDELLRNLETEPLPKYVSPERFKLHGLLGRGVRSRVLLASDETDKTLCAVKITLKKAIVRPHRDIEEEGLLNHLREEREILLVTNFEFLLKLFYLAKDNDYVYFVTEVTTHEPLIYLGSAVDVTEKELTFYVAQITLALEYLHSANIIHRDVKLDNILVFPDGYVKLGDFSFAKRLPDDGRTYTWCGTVIMMSPEMLKMEGYGKSIDWWNLGSAAYHLLFGLPPYQTGLLDRPKPDELTERHKKVTPVFTYGNNPKASITVANSTVEFLKRLLELDPSKRLGVAGPSVRNHKFFAGIDWWALYRKQYKPSGISDKIILVGCGKFQKSTKVSLEEEFAFF